MWSILCPHFLDEELVVENGNTLGVQYRQSTPFGLSPISPCKGANLVLILSLELLCGRFDERMSDRTKGVRLIANALQYPLPRLRRFHSFKNAQRFAFSSAESPVKGVDKLSTPYRLRRLPPLQGEVRNNCPLPGGKNKNTTIMCLTPFEFVNISSSPEGEI